LVINPPHDLIYCSYTFPAFLGFVFSPVFGLETNFPPVGIHLLTIQQSIFPSSALPFTVSDFLIVLCRVIQRFLCTLFVLRRLFFSRSCPPPGAMLSPSSKRRLESIPLQFPLLFPFEFFCDHFLSDALFLPPREEIVIFYLFG